MKHECSVPKCGARIPSVLLMCKRHWRMVKRKEKAEVQLAWHEYRAGQISLDQLRAVQNTATNCVAVLEALTGGDN